MTIRLVCIALALTVSCSEDDPCPANGCRPAGGDAGDTIGGGDGYHGDPLPGPGPGFLRLRAGSFWMGSPQIEEGRQIDEVHHHVTLSRNFWIEETEVTQGQFEALMGWNPSWFSANGAGAECGASCPVESVSWLDAVAYAIELSVRDGLAPCYLVTDLECVDTASADNHLECMSAARGGIDAGTVTLNGVSSVYDCVGYRLPSEAEWEYAARATVNHATYNGHLNGKTTCESPHETLDPIAWFCGNAGDTTHPVASVSGTDAANPWGLFDMLGNVWEWCWDWREPYAGDITDPEGPATGDFRLLRGGSWHEDAWRERAAHRATDHPNRRSPTVGFRMARSVRP